jgi:hypothetical protein
MAGGAVLAEPKSTSVSLWRKPAIAAPKRNRVNEEINVPQVRLIDADGNQVGVMDLRAAKRRPPRPVWIWSRSTPTPSRRSAG